MASRTRSTFEKRQKEMKRMEKQRMKAARRAERSQAKRAELDAANQPPMEVEEIPAEVEPQP